MTQQCSEVEAFIMWRGAASPCDVLWRGIMRCGVVWRYSAVKKLLDRWRGMMRKCVMRQCTVKLRDTVA